MPLFNTPHRVKTYSKTRHKDLGATTAFDKLVQDDHSSHVLRTHRQSSFQPANGNLETNISQSNSRDKRTRSDEDLFSFSSDDDQSSKCKRRRDTTSQGKTKTTGDGKVKERVTVKKSSQTLKNKCFLESSSSIDRRSFTSDNSKVIEKHKELCSATTNIPEEYLISEDSQKEKTFDISPYVSSLHQQRHVSSGADDNFTTSSSVTKQHHVLKIFDRVSDSTGSSKETTLHKEHSEQIQQLLGLRQMSSEKGILCNEQTHTIRTPESKELPSVQIQHFASNATTATTVDKKQDLSLKSNMTKKDKQQTSLCNSYSFAHSENSNALISATLDMSKAKDDKPLEATGIHQHVDDSDISLSSRGSSDSSYNRMKSPQENKLQAKTFVDKLSKLLAGKKSLVNEALPCVAPSTHQTNVISVGSSMHEVTSHKSLSTHDMFLELENKDSIKVLHNFPGNRSPSSVHFHASSDHFSLHKDSSRILALDTSPHSNSLGHLRHSALPSPLAEHNYFHCMEHNQKITDDHSYSLLSSPGNFTVPKSLVAVPMDCSDKLSTESGYSITTVGTQPFSTPLRKDTNQTYQETEFPSKQHSVCKFYKDSDVDDSCSVLLLSPLQGTPSLGASRKRKVNENITTDSTPLHSLSDDTSCKTTQEVHTCKNKRLKDKVMLKKPSKDIHLTSSVSLEDFQEKFCLTSAQHCITKCMESSQSALPHGNTDTVQSQPTVLMDVVEETLTESNRNQLHLHGESDSLSLQNSREAPETFTESHESDAVNLGNSDNKDSIQQGNTITKNCTIQGRTKATNSTKMQTEFVKRSAERRTRGTAVSGDLKSNITQDQHQLRKVEKSTSGNQKTTKAHVDHHTTKQGSRRTRTNECHVRHGNYTAVQLRKRIRSCATTDNTEQLKSNSAPDNIVKIRGHHVSDTGLSRGADSLSTRACDSRNVINRPHSKQKTQEKIATLSEYTDQGNVRRLLKSPLKTSSKTKAVYNPRQWLHPTTDEEVLADSTKGQIAKAVSALQSSSYEFSACDDSSPVLSRASSWPKRLQGNDVVKVRVSRDQKPLFAVVRNVKEAHECQEYGEKQEFQDDVDYMLDGLQCSQPLATRCLSTLSLASKCMVPAFRMHLRAHGILTKILEALHDAPQFVSLSICLSALLFTMSRDRLAIELDEFSVRLILRLLDADSGHCGNVDHSTSSAEELERIRIKVFAICTATIHSSKMPHVKLKPCDMTTGYLGLELLLSLTSKHTADWFKETLRSHGGLKHIINAACQCFDEIVRLSPADALSGHLHLYIRSENCLKVLDNVTYMCTENQSFLLEYKSSMLIEALNSFLSICIRDIASEESVASYQSFSGEKVNKDCTQFLVSTCLLTLLRLLLNITHDSERGCFVIGQQKNLLFTVLSSVLSTSAAVHQFDLSILGLSLLMNLFDNCEANRKRFIALKTRIPNNTDSDEEISALESLGMLFSQSFKAARVIEEVHDAKIEAAEKQQKLAANSAPILDSTSAEIDQSGQWVESESGLQWVAKEDQEEEQEDFLPERFKASLNRLHSQETPSSSQDDTDNYTKDLHTAGKHMEDSFVAAYTAVLIGSIIQHDMHLAETVRRTLPEFSFTPLVRMIRKFLGFMNFTNLTSASGSKTFHQVLKVLESCQPNPVNPS